MVTYRYWLYAIKYTLEVSEEKVMLKILFNDFNKYKEAYILISKASI